MSRRRKRTDASLRSLLDGVPRYGDEEDDADGASSVHLGTATRFLSCWIASEWQPIVLVTVWLPLPLSASKVANLARAALQSLPEAELSSSSEEHPFTGQRLPPASACHQLLLTAWSTVICAPCCSPTWSLAVDVDRWKPEPKGRNVPWF